MAKCKLSCHEFIQSTFCPKVAILASSDAENICLKNNLRFVDMLQPFCTQNRDLRIADPQGNGKTLKNFRLVFEDMNQRLPEHLLAKKILNESVNNSPWDKFVEKKVKSTKSNLTIDMEIPNTTPWFEVWRDVFSQLQYPSDHEFLRHYVACIIVISSASENAMDQLTKLSQYQHKQQHQNSNQLPKWFSPNILKFYLLLHDRQHDASRATALHTEMVSAFGAANCYLLEINSCPSNEPQTTNEDPWADVLKHRALVDGSNINAGNMDASSGTATPREDVSSFPSRVSEGDSPESDQTISHPLSDLSEQSAVFEEPTEMPLLLNKESIPLFTQHHGAFMTQEDVQRVSEFTYAFCAAALMPHIERQIKHLNEIVASRPRSKSLFSATRRWLGSSKPSSSTANSVVYSQEAAELQTRRLGDLCFLFRFYEMASTAYVTAKNDFKSDQAWLYFAGAQEMAGLALFMHVGVEYPRRYLEGSLNTYLNVCKVYNFAIRLTLLTTEILKNSSDFTDAAMMFIKMTSEESDLLSAIMLEQAAHCFINAQRPMPRKYAFHMTLAAHRFSKAGQKAHSLRAYKQALQVYVDRKWVLVEDHIFYSIGKQAVGLKKWSDGLQANICLMQQVFKSVSNYRSASQQLAYVREFLDIFHKFAQSNHTNVSDFLTGRELHSLAEKPAIAGPPSQHTHLVPLPIPVFHPNSTKVLLGDVSCQQELNEGWVNASGISFSDEDTREARWLALEEDLITHVQGHQMMFKPKLIRLSSATPNSSIAEVPQGELVHVEISIENPLLVGLTISNLRPIYEYLDAQGTVCDSGLTYDNVSPLYIAPQSIDYVRLRMFPQVLGKVLVQGVAFSLSLSDESSGKCVAGVNYISIRGSRLNAKLSDIGACNYAPDQRLNIQVIPSAAKLSICIKEPPPIMCCGEIYRMNVTLKNTGNIALTNLHVTSPNPKLVCLGSALKQIGGTTSSSYFSTAGSEFDPSKSVHRASKILLPNNELLPNCEIEDSIWLHAPLEVGAFQLELLFYYETQNYPIAKKYRLARHLSSIYLEQSLSLKVNSCPSVQVSPEHFQNDLTHRSTLVAEMTTFAESEGTPEIISVVGMSMNSKRWVLQPQQVPKCILMRDKQSNRLCIPFCHVRNVAEDSLLVSHLLLDCTSELHPCWSHFSLKERLGRIPSITEPFAQKVINDYIPPPPSGTQREFTNLKQSCLLNAVFTVIWKGFRGVHEIWGQQSVTLNELGDSVATPDACDALETPQTVRLRIIPEIEPSIARASPQLSARQRSSLVKVSVRTPSRIEHDFNCHVLCQIEYSYTLYNCCASPLKATLNFNERHTDNAFKATDLVDAKYLPVRSSIKSVSLEPYAHKDLRLTTLVTSPGTYSIGYVTLTLCTTHEQWIQSVDEFVNATVVAQSADILS